MNKEKILVLGDKGLLGNCLINKLFGKYTIVTIADRIDNNFFIDKDDKIDWVFNFAGSTGGIFFIKNNDYEVVMNNIKIDTKVLEESIKAGVKRIFYPSSACIYNFTQQGYNYKELNEMDDIPLNPDTLYGLEKAFAEKLYLSNNDIDVRIGRMFTVFGEQKTNIGKEKFITAIAKKIIKSDGEIEVFGTGEEKKRCYFCRGCCRLYNFFYGK